MHPSQPMRADARRNYEALIEVARRHLRSRGVSTSLEAIAREAGVGVGTLYRHFPDRNHLVFAALEAEGIELRETAERLRATAPAADRLERWLVELEGYLNSYHGLPDTMAQAVARGECPTTVSYQELIGITDEFLADAQEHGTARDWVSGQDLFRATLMLAWLNTQIPESATDLESLRRMIRSGWSGQRSTADGPTAGCGASR